MTESYRRYREKNPDDRSGSLMLRRAMTVLVLCIIAVVLWRTGAYFTIRNWITGEYQNGETAFHNSQENFGDRLAKSRQKQAEHQMGTGDTGH